MLHVVVQSRDELLGAVEEIGVHLQRAQVMSERDVAERASRRLQLCGSLRESKMQVAESIARMTVEFESRRRAAPDFRSLPTHAWQCLHARFATDVRGLTASSVMPLRSTALPAAPTGMASDFRALPSAAWQSLHASFAPFGDAGRPQGKAKDLRGQDRADAVAWPRREAERLRQVGLCRASQKYRFYIANLAICERGPEDPMTPDYRDRELSKKLFGQTLGAWKRKLRDYETSVSAWPVSPEPGLQACDHGQGAPAIAVLWDVLPTNRPHPLNTLARSPPPYSPPRR